MKPSSMLLSLFIAVLLLWGAPVLWVTPDLWVVPAYADDDDDDDDDSGIGVLLDANGITIGKVVGISGSAPIVDLLFEVSGQTFSAKIIGHNQSDLVLAGFQKRRSVLFDNVNCTGEAWTSIRDAIETAFFDEFRVAIIVGDTPEGFGDSPEERRLYAPTSDVSELRTVNSVMEEFCSNIATDVREVVPVILLDGDLHTTFPKPYSLVLN